MGVIDNELNWRGVRPIPGINGVWPGPNAYRVNVTGMQNGLGETIIYTVPANYKLFIASLFMCSKLSADGDHYSYVGVRDGGDVDQYFPILHLYDAKGQQTSSPRYVPALEAAALWDVFVLSAHANIDAWATIFGWLEAV